MLRSPSIRHVLGLVLVLLAVGTAGVHAAGRRVALLIGNNAYRHTSALQNCVNDARAMGEALGSLGFEVKTVLDADRSGFNDGFSWLEARAKDAELGLVFYSGHGVQVAGVNYLAPVDANMNSASEIRRQGINATEIAGNLQESGCKTSILILDACRNNPFEKGIRGAATRGLAPMQASEDSLIAFAADAGQVAADNPDEPNGLYTQELLKHLKTPGIPIEEVFKRTRTEVRRRSDRKQTPAEYSKLEGNIVLVPAAAEPPATPVPTPSEAALPAAAVRSPRPAPEDCYALCVGISRYPGIRGAPGTSSALDARAVRWMLVETMRIPASHVRLLLDEDATLHEFQQALRWLAANARHDRTLYLFWSGSGMVSGSSGLLVLHDGGPGPQPGTFVNVFRSRDLREWLGTLAGARVLIVLDHSSAEAMAGELEGTAASRRCVPSLPQGAALLAACSWNGLAWATDMGGRFTNALTDIAPDGLTLTELAERVRSRIRKLISTTMDLEDPRHLPVLIDRTGEPDFVPFWTSSGARRP